MHVNLPSLLDVCRRAGLSVVLPADGVDDDAGEDANRVPCRTSAWDGLVFTVVAAPDALNLSIEQAVSDVEHLWPGRDPAEGAIALISTALQAAVESRLSPPKTVTLDGTGAWIITPPETWPSTKDMPLQTEWRAP